ncbi:MAG: anhydro-N-acetylmuramic acid kinase, partial [Gemmatimonadales bacterium]|nr:anhydro-N-acetylmuramic acid kinase [Gemmatimonadales bacterium]
LTELTARTSADAYRWIEEPPTACYLCGGGARNPVLASRLERLLDPMPVRDLSALGLDADAREAVAFAFLARQHVLGYPANAPWATGARGPRLLGVRTAA